MRWLTIGVAVLALGWSAYWFVGRAAFERGVVAGIEAARAAGWDVAYDDLSVTGFPNRFDATLDAPRVVAPGGAFGWSAPFVQAFALSYRPNRLIVVAADAMVLDLPLGRVDVTTEDLRASVALSASTRPEFERATAVAARMALAGAGIDATVEGAQLAMRRTEGEAEYDVALSVAGLRLGDALRAAVDPSGALPAAIRSLDANVHATLDRPLGVEGEPRLVAMRIEDARLVWGDLRLDLGGAVAFGADGAPDGTLTLDAAGWEAALRIAAALGAVPEAQMPLLTAGLAGMAGEDGTIALDLTFADGAMRLGAIPLGPAPRLPPLEAPGQRQDPPPPARAGRGAGIEAGELGGDDPGRAGGGLGRERAARIERRTRAEPSEPDHHRLARPPRHQPHDRRHRRVRAAPAAQRLEPGDVAQALGPPEQHHFDPRGGGVVGRRDAGQQRPDGPRPVAAQVQRGRGRLARGRDAADPEPDRREQGEHRQSRPPPRAQPSAQTDRSRSA